LPDWLLPPGTTSSSATAPHLQGVLLEFDSWGDALFLSDVTLFWALEVIMDSDQIKGKAKDIAGRVERQAGEWTGDENAQAEGTAKQAEGKVQNAYGKAKDKARKFVDAAKKKDKDRDVA
jgi:uncharacterized protein YjbJ (UPF0337 family)